MGEATKQLCIGLYSPLVFVLTFPLYYYAVGRRSLSFEGWLEARGIGGLENEELREVLMNRDCRMANLYTLGLDDHEGVLVGEYLCYNQVIEHLK